MIETLRLARRTPGCLLLLTGNFAVAFGSNLVLPYLAVFLTREEGLSSAVVAVAITVKFWSQQGLTMLGGWIADRVGPVGAMCMGLLIRALSYLAILGASGPVQVVAACALLGFGGAIYVPASKSALVRLLGTGEQLRTLFALRSTANNAGNALGPLAGSLLLLLADARVGFVITSAVFVVLAVVLLRLRTLPAADEPAARTSAETAASPLDYRQLAWVLLCAFAFGFCYIQLEYALPVFTGSVQNPAFVGVLFTVNAAAVVLLQVPLNQTVSRISGSAVVIAGALLLMGSGFAAASLGSMAGLIVCVLLFSIGEVLIDPRLDSEIAASIPAHRRGMAFGFVGTAIAAGGAAANGLAAMLSTGQGAVDRSFWLILVAVSAGFAAIIYVTSLTRSRVLEASAKS
ncbi:MFS transporter [Streptomyces shaanxiensis]|uniref:Major facilitator superfamily (MFS) profile domain-containing protein n=1 Tax=Streptomyces shaanxiensis TaxID=653357 RepID=A0ABP7VC83_9ACTN